MLKTPKIVAILNDQFAAWGLTSEAKEVKGAIEYTMQGFQYSHPVNVVIEHTELIEVSAEESKHPVAQTIEVKTSLYFNITTRNDVTPVTVNVGNLHPDVEVARKSLLPIFEKVIAWQLSRMSKKLDRIDFKFVPFIPASRPLKKSKALERPVAKIVMQPTKATATGDTKSAATRPVEPLKDSTPEVPRPVKQMQTTNPATARPPAKTKVK